jgi:hypothetical protein
VVGHPWEPEEREKPKCYVGKRLEYGFDPCMTELKEEVPCPGLNTRLHHALIYS